MTLQLGADASLVDVENKMTECCIAKVPVPGVLPCRVLLGVVLGCEHSLRDHQGLLKENLLRLAMTRGEQGSVNTGREHSLNSTLYLGFHSFPYLGKAFLAAQQLGPIRVHIALHTEFVPTASIPEVEGGRQC